MKSKEKQKSSRGGKEKKGRKRERGGRRRRDKRDAALRRYVDLEANVGGDEDEDDDGDYDTGEAAEARKLERDLIYKVRQRSPVEAANSSEEEREWCRTDHATVAFPASAGPCSPARSRLSRRSC